MVHVGETSDGKRKRGRPSSQLSTEDEEERKKRKKINDQRSRDDNKAADVIARLTELALVDQSNQGELQQNQGQNVTRSFPEKKVQAICEKTSLPGVSEVEQALRNEAEDHMRSNRELKGVSEVEQPLRNEAEDHMRSNRESMETNRESNGVSQVEQPLRNEAEDHMRSNRESMKSNRELKASIDRLSNQVAPVAPQDDQIFEPLSGIAVAEQEEIYNSLANIDLSGNGYTVGINQMNFAKEIGINETITRRSTSSDQNGERFDDEHVETFFKQYDGNTKRQVKYSDFNGLEEELNKLERNVIPSFLTPTAQKIKAAYGDIAKDCTLGDCAIYPTRIMLYATIKEIDELKDLKDVSMAKLEVWRDAIIDAQQFKFIVEFAKSRLTKIACAYFGLKANDPNLDEQRRN